MLWTFFATLRFDQVYNLSSFWDVSWLVSKAGLFHYIVFWFACYNWCYNVIQNISEPFFGKFEKGSRFSKWTPSLVTATYWFPGYLYIDLGTVRPEDISRYCSLKERWDSCSMLFHVVPIFQSIQVFNATPMFFCVPRCSTNSYACTTGPWEWWDNGFKKAVKLFQDREAGLSRFPKFSIQSVAT